VEEFRIGIYTKGVSMLNYFLTGTLVLLMNSTLAQAEAGKRATAKFSVKQTNDKVMIEALAVPAKGLVINNDGPWKLTVENAQGFTVTNKTSTNYSDKTPGIVTLEAKADAKAKSKKHSFDYQFTTFVCTADKSMCYREVLKGKHNS
jgi:hypothetical protein